MQNDKKGYKIMAHEQKKKTPRIFKIGSNRKEGE